ncbi:MULTISPECIES: uracil-DNA glycosylase [unclassified Dysgonomonas]|uniref:uracil-DNA glycosylase n=1 Tax=unclassified Dysgonomonas TaxID=2630389 RepID=UPI00068065A6|nr:MULTISPECIES: uracil-DNA glycosylase [unclassified Dysgonomonas]MBD8347904.1 uracil-DNA glycosylase [Dysgonomonas sp. HGC4]MBF0577211.1 uracil-DNA glycosylase [Dysgonomonas sp. GY617]
MDVKIEESWKAHLKDEFEKEYFIKVTNFIRSEYQTKQIFPPAKLIFNAFDHTPFDKVKVVILGQDPYHNDGQAHGLSFSVNDGIQFPPSLINIFKEINADLGIPIPKSGNLTRWADQGVLLLNATLTVQAHQAGSHQNKGWENFTDAAIKKLADERENLVFLLWGSYAQKKAAFIDGNKHLILKSVHPSPLSAHRGFFGNKHFSQINEYLVSKGQTPIEW